MQSFYAVVRQVPDGPEGAGVVEHAFLDPHKALEVLREVTDDFTRLTPHYYIQEIKVE